MNVLFFADSIGVYIEYALRLENNGIPFWTASNNNTFHQIMMQVKIEVIFVDYHMMNFKKFDVYKHIARFRKDLVLIFLNSPDACGELLVQWEDQVQTHFPSLWTRELDQLLRIMADTPVNLDYSYKPAKVQELLEQIEGGMGDGQGNDTDLDDKRKRAVVPSLRSHEKSTAALAGARRELGIDLENKSMEEFLWLHRQYKLGYQDYAMMSLFLRKKNEFVTIGDLLRVLQLPQDKKGLNTVYQCIHRIRRFLEKSGQAEVELVRIKKGCYCLVSLK